jgi:ribosome modulation factor
MSGRGASRKARLKAMKTGPYWQGVAAFELGRPQTANPYGGPGRGKAHTWLKGWREARRVKEQA